MTEQKDSPLNIIDKISHWDAKIAGWLILVMALIIGFEVISRYIFNSPTIWVMELSMFLLVICSCLAGATTLLRNEHVGMDLVYVHLPPRARAILDLVTGLFLFVYLGVVFWQGILFVRQSIAWMERTESIWAPLIWPAKIAIPIGAFLLFLQALRKYISDIQVVFGRGECKK